MLGWFVAHPGVPLTPEPSTVKLHKKSFPKKNTVFIMKDPVEKDETYYVHKMNDLMEIGGHYTYYEKNPCMQNYMISSRKKNGVSSTETVEDRAAKDFRNMVRTRGERQRQKKTGNLMYAASAALVLIVIVMGVTMISSFDRMKSVQSTLNSLTGKTDTVETRETSGQVTAVTSDEETDTDAENKDGTQNDQKTDETVSRNTGDSRTGSPDTDADTENKDEPGKTDADTAEDPVSDSGTDTSENGSDGIYVVEEGDTLAIISRKMYGDVSHVDAICRMNGITDGNLIYVGQKLLLP